MSTKQVGINYYAAQGLEKGVKAPDEYPLSHVFEDVGLAVMTNDLTDPGRIQLSFNTARSITAIRNKINLRGVEVTVFLTDPELYANREGY